jgi:hypothetical protein
MPVKLDIGLSQFCGGPQNWLYVVSAVMWRPLAFLGEQWLWPSLGAT